MAQQTNKPAPTTPAGSTPSAVDPIERLKQIHQMEKEVRAEIDTNVRGMRLGLAVIREVAERLTKRLAAAVPNESGRAMGVTPTIEKLKETGVVDFDSAAKKLEEVAASFVPDTFELPPVRVGK